MEAMNYAEGIMELLYDPKKPFSFSAKTDELGYQRGGQATDWKVHAAEAAAQVPRELPQRRGSKLREFSFRPSPLTISCDVALTVAILDSQWTSPWLSARCVANLFTRLLTALRITSWMAFLRACKGQINHRLSHQISCRWHEIQCRSFKAWPMGGGNSNKVTHRSPLKDQRKPQRVG